METKETTKSDSKLQKFATELVKLLSGMLGACATLDVLTDAEKDAKETEFNMSFCKLIQMWYDSILTPTANDIALMSTAVGTTCSLYTQVKASAHPDSEPKYDAHILGNINDCLQRYLKLKAKQLGDTDEGKKDVLKLIEANMTTAAPKAV